MDWVIEELTTLRLSDSRLNKRAEQVLSQLSCNPTDSIPTACCGAAETKAAYRFFDNDKVTAEHIYSAHFDATLSRMSHQPIVLLAQDTTVLNFSTQFMRGDAGPTTKDSTKGIYLHCSLAMTPERRCLGTLSPKQWHRDELQKLTREEKKRKNYAAPLEEKESYRWLEHYLVADNCAKKLPETTVVSIGDRESDIYDIYEIAQEKKINKEICAHYLIRAKHDRRLSTETGMPSEGSLKTALRQAPSLGELEVQLSATASRKARTARLSVSAKRVTLSLPDKRKKPDNYQPVEVNAILCSEIDTPNNENRVEWLLLTDLPVENFSDACEKIQWYCCRWEIEIYFKVLKSGCTIEKLQLTDNNFRVALSFYLIIAWRVLFVTKLGRQVPNLSCDIVFSREEWETTHVVLYRTKPPTTPPTLQVMVRMVASLGGYLNRASDPEPGVKVLWIGMRNMQEHLKARDAIIATYGPICG